jgi:hypothetical protein
MHISRVVSNTVKTATLFGGLALMSNAALAAESSFDRTLTVTPNAYVYVSTGSGYIHISPGSDSQVHIVGHVKSNGSSWFGGRSPDDRVKDIAANPPIEQNGNEVHIGKKNSGDWQRNVTIDYEITAPKGAKIDAGSGSGDLRISDFSGGLKAGTGSGGIEARGISGAVELSTGSGDIHADLINPASTKAETGSGSIRLNGVQGWLRPTPVPEISKFKGSRLQTGSW